MFTYRLGPVALCAVFHAPVAGVPYNDRLVIRLSGNKRADGVPSDSLDKTGVAPQHSCADAVCHVPYVNSVV